MKQDPESLRELLARVHERLHGAKTVEPESRALLTEIMRDIEHALGKTAVSRRAEEHPPRLESLAVEFEAEHPALAQALRQLADLLGKAGI